MKKMINSIDINDKIYQVEKERNMTESEFESLLDTLKTLIKENKIEVGVVDILKTYTQAINDIGRKLNVLYELKGETKEK